MSRKSIGLKFEEEDVEAWDAWAEAHGFTRTSAIETAMEHLMAGPVPVVPPRRAGGVARGSRRAFICEHEVKGVRDCNRRIFLTPDEPDRVPDCPEHGAMVRQENRPYLGQATT